MLETLPGDLGCKESRRLILFLLLAGAFRSQIFEVS